MKKLAQKFLSDMDKKKIQKAVEDAEQQTSGEIVPMVVSSSYHYPMANVIGATAVSLPLSIIFTPLIDRQLWLETQDMWTFIILFFVLFALLHALIDLVPWFKRIFISPGEIEEEVQETATTTFFKNGLYRTRDETGVLIFISIFECKVWVLADRGINEKVAKDQWQEIVQHIINGIKQHRQADAICEAVGMVGKLLKTHFPVKPDDTDELPDLIIGDGATH